MKRMITVATTVAALLLSGIAVATSASATDAPSCGSTLSALATAEADAKAPAAALKVLVEAQILLDKAVVDAKAKLAANVDPLLVGSLTVAVTVAEQAAAAGKVLVDAAGVKNAAAVKLVLDAQLARDKACTVSTPTPTVTVTPLPEPVVYQQVPVYPSVAPATGGGPA